MKKKILAVILSAILIFLTVSSVSASALTRTYYTNKYYYFTNYRTTYHNSTWYQKLNLYHYLYKKSDPSPSINTENISVRKPTSNDSPTLNNDNKESVNTNNNNQQTSSEIASDKPVADSIRQFEMEVVRLVNVERQKAGVAPLKENADLSRVARIKSQDMRDNGYFSHTSPTYGSPFDMMKQFGINYSAAGENIAMGQKTPEDVVNAWMNSPGHRSNILNSNYMEIGVGYAADGNGTTYWTQMFIKAR